ncbi:MAG: YSC84-related protein [Pseudomonadales bacterium]
MTLTRAVRWSFVFIGTLLLSACATTNRSYDTTMEVFRSAGESAKFFDDAYGYAIFPTVGKGGLVLGGARGTGRVYEQGTYVGEAVMTQVSAGVQAGGQAYSMIIFFEDDRAMDEFKGGNFEFGAQAAAVVVTAGANYGTSTTGSSGTISGGRRDAITRGGYYKGAAVFTVAKGGLMLEVSLGGQKFTFTPVAG